MSGKRRQAKASGRARAAIGRPRAAIGIDVGGTSAKIVLLREPREILAETSVLGTAKRSAGDLTRALADAAAPLLDAERGTPVAGVGIGIAGFVDHRRGLLHRSPNLPLLREYRIGHELGRVLRVPVRVDNDANVSLLAEARIGAAIGHPNVVLLTLGTGIGGAFLFGGRLFRGARGFAGEAGHVVLDPSGPRCACGASGCLEAFIGSGGILRRARRRGGRFRNVREIRDAAKSGDALAREVVEETGRYLGAGLANLATLLDPDGFVLAGGVSLLGAPLFRAARRSLASSLCDGPGRRYPVVPAFHGARTGAVGAAVLALEEDHPA